MFPNQERTRILFCCMTKKYFHINDYSEECQIIYFNIDKQTGNVVKVYGDII